MAFNNNLDYLYNNLPARYRRDDQGLFLKRFLTWFGDNLDLFDEKRDGLHTLVNPQTTNEVWLAYLLDAFFGWAWFPANSTFEQKREFYANITHHYARRGTIKGIEEFLRAFGVQAIVEGSSPAWEDVAWGQHIWVVSDPLTLIIRVLPGSPLTDAELDELIRFCWPLGHWILIETLPEVDQQPLFGDELFGE